MARFIMVTYPLDGHMNPNLPIAKKLIQNGHDVLWIAGRMFEEKVKTTGALYHPLPIEIDFGDEQIYDFFPKLKKLKGLAQSNYYIKHVFIDAALPVIKAIDSALKYFPADILIGDSIVIGVFFMSEISGIPSVMISAIPFGMLSKDTAFYGLGIIPGKTFLTKMRDRFLNFIISDLLLNNVNKYTNKLRRNLGLKPFRKSVFSAYFDIPTLVLQLSSPCFEYPRRDLPGTFRFIGPVLPKPEQNYCLPQWWPELKGSKPVILINQGTVATNPNDLIIPAVNGLKSEELLLVAAPVNNENLELMPANVYAEPFIPHSNIMPHVDIMITNGGIGATQMALSHGVPLIIAGATEDKMEVAARVEWSGCGINLRKRFPSSQDYLRAVKKIIGDKRFKQNAKRLQAEIRKYAAPEMAVKLMEGIKNQQFRTFQENNRFGPNLPSVLGINAEKKNIIQSDHHFLQYDKKHGCVQDRAHNLKELRIR